jgi:hypothetical protein
MENVKPTIIKIVIVIILFSLITSCGGNTYSGGFTRSAYTQQQVDKCVRVFEYPREKCELIIDNPNVTLV